MAGRGRVEPPARVGAGPEGKPATGGGGRATQPTGAESGAARSPADHPTARPGSGGERRTTAVDPGRHPEPGADLRHVRPGPRRRRCRHGSPPGRPHDDITEAGDSAPTREQTEYRLPETAILDDIPIPTNGTGEETIHRHNEEIIKKKLAGFGIPAEITGRNAGRW